MSAGAVRLLSLTRPNLLALLGGINALDGRPILAGALPPPIIFQLALNALDAGGEPFFCQPRLVLAAEAIVGTIGFKGPLCEGVIELGYNVAPTCQGRGYATDAVRQLSADALAYAAVATVRAETAVDNIASRRVLEKAGFAHAGQRLCPNDGPLDIWLLARQPCQDTLS